MRGEELERGILGSLMNAPVFLEGAPGLNVSLFDGWTREVFEVISAVWKERRPEERDEEMDPVIVAGRMKGNCPVYLITALTDGRQRVTLAAFRDQVRELQLEKSYYKLMHTAEEAVKHYAANGIRDPSQLAAALAEYAQLERSGGPLTVDLSTIEPKAISWLWSGWIPGGMFTLAVGDPGVGKSFLSVDLAARLSRGGPFPDGAKLEGGACETLFINDEDPPAEAIRPRLDACEADQTKISLLKRPDFCLTDTATLRTVFQDRPGIKLVILDPVTAYFPAKTDIFKASQVRRALGPLIGFAEETGVAILGICHYRKADVDAAILKVSGSVALPAAARSIISVTMDEDDRGRRLLLPLKCSYVERPPGLAFRITGEPARIVFDGPVTETAEDVLPGREIREARRERSDADGFLAEQLREGPRKLSEIEEAAGAAGFPMRTVYHAAERLRVNKSVKGHSSARVATWRLER